MILEIFSLITTTLICWSLGFLLHECMHLVEAKRQGGNGYIRFRLYHGIPGLIIYLENIKNKALVDFAGGIYTAAIILPLAIISSYLWYPLHFALLLVGIVNLIYGIYEGLAIRNLEMDDYMKYHYILYGLVILVYLIIEGPYMLDYVIP